MTVSARDRAVLNIQQTAQALKTHILDDDIPMTKYMNGTLGFEWCTTEAEGL